MEDYLQGYFNEMKLRFTGEKSGHDINHSIRVERLSVTIGKDEGCNLLTLSIGSFLHDVHRLMQNKAGKHVTPYESLPEVEAILDKFNTPTEIKVPVLTMIRYHDTYHFTGEKEAYDIETQVLQDADRLDAIGAIGMIRTAYYSSAHSTPMWAPELPLKTSGEYHGSDNDPSMIHHCHNKLLRLADNMNTETGRKIAKQRHEFMQQFIDQFLDEWDGKR